MESNRRVFYKGESLFVKLKDGNLFLGLFEGFEGEGITLKYGWRLHGWTPDILRGDEPPPKDERFETVTLFGWDEIFTDI